MRYFFRPKAIGAAFVHPLISAPKTIILAPGFRESRSTRVFANGWCDEAARFGPCAVAAPLHQLRQLAREGVELHYAAIVLTYSQDSCLSDEDRDFLWNAFGVPVFEQFLGPDNELLASECEAHDGLHVVGSVGGIRLEKSVCGCGSTVPRMMPQWETAELQAMVA